MEPTPPVSENNIRMEPGWKALLSEEFRQPYFAALRQFLLEEKQKGKIIYPPGPQMFHAFQLTPPDQVKVVILGQDPYHGPGQAMGLCFSVPDGVKPPPSLVNILVELKNDLGIPPRSSGNLEGWARQGVLLLNALLSVEANQPASHHGKGWETFTDAVIRKISAYKKGIVFLLWGNYAISKRALIDEHKHHVLTAAHPSPFSVYRGFYGCKHFSQTNELLRLEGQLPIDWSA